MIKAIIFDIDGVLVDSFNSNHAFLQDILKTAGYKKFSRPKYRTVFHMTLKDVLRHLADIKNQAELQRVFEIAIQTVYPIEKFVLPKGSLKVLSKLHKKYKLGVVTSRMEKGVDNYFSFAKTKRFFKAIIHLSDVKNPKPHPESLFKACKKLKVKPAEAIYIGDSLTDIQAAHAAGMKIILYNPKKLPGADWHARKFEDILKITSYLQNSQGKH